MLHPRSTRATRRGFTLVEMMVAMALSLGIMLILTEAFRISLDFIRGANSTGVMISQLNGAGNALKRDLEREHFLTDDSRPNRGVRLSDLRFDQGAPAPTAGFFWLRSNAPASTFYDSEGLGVNSVTSHALHFSVALPGGLDQNIVTAASTAGVPYPTARAAEIAYFLVDTGLRTSVTGQPLYKLVRRYRLVALDDTDRPRFNPYANDPDVIAGNGTNTAYTLAELTLPARRMALSTASFPAPLTSPLTFGPTNLRYGEDILASNVLSFEIRAKWDGAPTPRAFNAPNTEYPFDFLQTAASTFDTSAPAPIRINMLRITLRVFDPNTKQTRQNTWEFAM